MKLFKNKKSIAMLVSLIALLAVVVGVTVAFLVDKTDSITNTFTSSKTEITIEEELEDGVKKDVTVENTGDVEAYIRAAVVVTWKNDAGEVYATAPVAETDYKVTYPGEGWVQSGNYYYYTSPVAPNDSTGILLTNCEPIADKTPNGYHLSVEILAQSIQAEPDTAVQQAWGVSVGTDGNLSIS